MFYKFLYLFIVFLGRCFSTLFNIAFIFITATISTAIEDAGTVIATSETITTPLPSTATRSSTRTNLDNDQLHFLLTVRKTKLPKLIKTTTVLYFLIQLKKLLSRNLIPYLKHQ